MPARCPRPSLRPERNWTSPAANAWVRLPLGTIAKVTNLKTGRSAVVKIQDRGPFVKGRIVDLSPATARAVGLTAKEGVAPVEVTPIEVPMPDGSVRPGDAAREPVTRTQVARAREHE